MSNVAPTPDSFPPPPRTVRLRWIPYLDTFFFLIMPAIGAVLTLAFSIYVYPKTDVEATWRSFGLAGFSLFLAACSVLIVWGQLV
jgi:hypothetical protein